MSSLDFPSTVALAAVVSAVATFLAARFAPNFVWYVAIGGPFLIVYLIYCGLDASEYASWWWLFLPPLYFAAAISSLVAISLFRVLSKTFKELSPDDVTR